MPVIMALRGNGSVQENRRLDVRKPGETLKMAGAGQAQKPADMLHKESAERQFRHRANQRNRLDGLRKAAIEIGLAFQIDIEFNAWQLVHDSSHLFTVSKLKPS